jgi:TetR/AcrR family transcriptional repressor of nem operon
MQAVAAEPDGDARARAFERYCASYVSPKARDALGASCPMVAFAADVSRQGEAVRAAYADGLSAYLEAFVAASQSERAEAIRQFAALTGALTLARSVAAENPELSNEILAAARRD